MSANNQAIQLERAITHLLIADWDKLMLYSPLLDERMFLEPVNHKFLVAARELYSEGNLTKLNLLDRLEGAGVKQADLVYTQQVAAVTSSSDFLKHYTAWIEHARVRFIERCDAALVETNPSSSDLISGRLSTLEKAKALGFPDEGTTMSQAIDEGVKWQKYLRSVDGRLIVSTGFQELDRNIIGLVPGTLTTLAARPSGGKTTLACAWGMNASAAGPVLFNTLEMSPSRIAFKLAAIANGDNAMAYDRSFKAAEPEFDAICQVLLKQNGMNFRFFEKQDPAALESAIILLKPSLVIWDYLQLVSTPARFAGRRSEYIGEVARQLQQVAKRRNVPVLLLSQLNRDGDGGGAAMANLKDSSGIEEASDNIFFLETPNENAEGADRLRRILSIKKARSGFAGTSLELMMNPRTGAFEYWNTILAAQLAEEMVSDS